MAYDGCDDNVKVPKNWIHGFLHICHTCWYSNISINGQHWLYLMLLYFILQLTTFEKGHILFISKNYTYYHAILL